MVTSRIARRRAVERLLAHLPPVAPQSVSPAGAVGRTAALDARAAADVPDRPTSLRDGYAVRSAEIADAEHRPVHLAVNRTVRADSPEGGTLAPGEAVRVLTGGLAPDGADAVLAEEDVRHDDHHIEVREPARPGWFIRPRGGEVPAGAVVIRAGEPVTPQGAAVLLRAGVRTLAVHPVPRARALALGSELADPADPHPPAEARFPADNLVLVGGLLRRAGADVIATGVLPDRLETVVAALSGDQPDLVITSGGTGRSERDFARQSAEAAGFTVLFEGLDIRPGRNVFGALRGGTLLLGLPGPPAAVFACFHALALPVLRALRGLALPAEPRTARVETGFSVRPGSEWIVPCTLHHRGATLIAAPLIDKALPPLLAVGLAHGVALIPGGQGLLPGDEVRIDSVDF